MKSGTYLNILEQRDSCNVEELHRVILDVYKEKKYDEDGNIEEDNQIVQLYEVVNSALKKNKFIGTSADFHNLSVECARRNAEEVACDFLERGLDKYPISVDLLADYIKYGVVCNRIENCRRYYSTLDRIPKSNWNWRAFRFSIDYLMVEMEREICGSEIKQTMLSLAEEFRRYIPDDENGYLVQAEVHSRFNEKELEIAILEEAVAKLPRASKSLLRLADIYYMQGRVEEALSSLCRCELDSLEPQMGVSQGYLYYLDGLCQSNILLRELDNVQIERDAIREKELKIYDSLKIAKKSLDHSFNLQNEWKFLVNMLEVKTKVEYRYY